MSEEQANRDKKPIPFVDRETFEQLEGRIKGFH